MERAANMRALLWLVIIAFAGWSGWWWIASDTARKGTVGGLAALVRAGWQAEAEDIGVTGYPNRIDLTLTAPTLSPPGRHWSWRTPFVQVFALSYKPWHLVAVAANEQQIETPLGPMALTTSSLRSSLVLVPGTDATLDRFQIVAEDLALSSPLGPVQAAALSLATRPAADPLHAHDLGLEVVGIALPGNWLQQAGLTGKLSPFVDVLHIDARIDPDAAVNRHSLQNPPKITGITLREARLEWGDLRLHLSGRVTPGPAGLAEGTMELRLSGLETALDVAETLGMLPSRQRQAIGPVLANLVDPQGVLTVPLTMAGGRTWLSGLPLWAAPRFPQLR